MLIVRGVNIFPSAVREVVARFKPDVSGVISIRPTKAGVKQSPPLPVFVELAEGAKSGQGLGQSIHKRLRESLLVTTEISLVKFGTLPRSDYKSKLVEWPKQEAGG